MTNEAGETTRFVPFYILRKLFVLKSLGSHLMGFFYRTIRMVENGIKPVYVFDGKPPELKAGVVSGHSVRRNFALSILRSSPSVSKGEKKLRRREKRPKRPVS